MIDLRLEYIGGGNFRCRSKLDFELCSRDLTQGETVRVKLTRQRSVRQNDYFHAVIEAAWDNQRAGPQFPTWRHLKSWLLIQAGHCTVRRFEPRAITPEVAAFLRATFDTVDFTTDGTSIFLKVAKSVRFSPGGATAAEMGAITTKVVEIVCNEIVPGIEPVQLLDMAKKKAA